MEASLKRLVIWWNLGTVKNRAHGQMKGLGSDIPGFSLWVHNLVILWLNQRFDRKLSLH